MLIILCRSIDIKPERNNTSIANGKLSTFNKRNIDEDTDISFTVTPKNNKPMKLNISNKKKIGEENKKNVESSAR